jgi:hypothetical protein
MQDSASRMSIMQLDKNGDVGTFASISKMRLESFNADTLAALHGLSHLAQFGGGDGLLVLPALP